MDYEELSVLGTLTSDQALSEIAKTLAHDNQSQSFAISMLETSNCEFVFFASSLGQSLPMPSYSLDEVSITTDLLKPYIENIEAVPIARGNTIIGHIFNSRHGSSSQFDKRIVGVLAFIFNRRQQERFTSSLNAPVPFDIEPKAFFNALRDLAKGAASSTHGAYRAINSGRLECLFQWGFDDLIDDADALSVDIGTVPVFERAVINKKPTPCRNLSVECRELIDLQPFQSNVISFYAVPVLVGERVTGLLTVAFTQEYQFTPIEIDSLLCLANGIGISISNYKSHWRGKKFESDFEEIASSVTALEVVHQIKHNIIDNSGAALTRIDLVSQTIDRLKIGSREKQEIHQHLSVMESQITKVEKDIIHIGEAVNADRILEYTSVKSIWDEVCEHLNHRILELGVKVNSIKGGHERIIIKGIIKHIFQNLILNSLDAFEKSSKTDKQIGLKWISTGSKTSIWRIQYYDNGPGLPISHLKQQIREEASRSLSDVDPDIPVGEFIFRPKVTTKPNGTGQGLFLSRNVARQHLGGIEYNHSGNEGVSFDIEICFDLRKILSHSNRPIFYRDKNGYKQQLTDYSTFLDEFDTIMNRRY